MTRQYQVRGTDIVVRVEVPGAEGAEHATIVGDLLVAFCAIIAACIAGLRIYGPRFGVLVSGCTKNFNAAISDIASMLDRDYRARDR